MSVVAELRIRSEEMVLAAALSAVPEIRLEVVAEAATDPQKPYLYVWAHGPDRERFEAAMAEDPTIADVCTYEACEDRTLYRLAVSERTGVVTYPAWVEFGVNLLQATWSAGWWRLRVRVPDRGTVGRLEEWCRDYGVDFELEGVVTEWSDPADEARLSPAQREVLLRAYELGYFEIPRRHSMADVAAELGVSSQAVSERLRRGVRQLVAAHVV